MLFTRFAVDFVEKDYRANKYTSNGKKGMVVFVIPCGGEFHCGSERSSRVLLLSGSQLVPQQRDLPGHWRPDDYLL